MVQTDFVMFLCAQNMRGTPFSFTGFFILGKDSNKQSVYISGSSSWHNSWTGMLELQLATGRCKFSFCAKNATRLLPISV